MLTELLEDLEVIDKPTISTKKDDHVAASTMTAADEITADATPQYTLPANSNSPIPVPASSAIENNRMHDNNHTCDNNNQTCNSLNINDDAADPSSSSPKQEIMKMMIDKIISYWRRYLQPIYVICIEDSGLLQFLHSGLYYGHELFFSEGQTMWQTLDEWWIVGFYRLLDMMRALPGVNALDEVVQEGMLLGVLGLLVVVVVFFGYRIIAAVVLILITVCLCPVLLVVYGLLKLLVIVTSFITGKKKSGTVSKKKKASSGHNI